LNEVFEILSGMPNESIYDAKRLALPDEIWNFGCGDGIEKALLMADYIILKDNSSKITLEIDNRKVRLNYNGKDYHFTSSKSFRKSINITGNTYIIN
jgi:hypothetical protein